MINIVHDATEAQFLPQDYVPYINATDDVDLGNNLIIARQIIAKSGLDQTNYDVNSITDYNGNNFPFPDFAGKLLNEGSQIPLNNINLGGNATQYLRGDNTLQTLPTIANSSVKNETPIGLINGSNTTFTSLNNFVPQSIEVFVNGLIQQKIIEFNTIGNTTITLNFSPTVGEIITINYIKL
jgi:hypothetical protein